MTDIKLLIDADVHKASLDTLRTMRGVECEVIPFKEELREIPAVHLRGKRGLFCTYPPRNLGDMDALEWIQITSAGYEHLFGTGIVERGIRVTNALGNFDVPISEWNIAMMINLARDLRGMIRNQETGAWDRSKQFQHEIRGSTVGLWGYGGIGRETARLAKALGLKVHVLSRGGVKPRTNIYRVEGTGDSEGKLPDRVFHMDKKDEFLRGLDFLILAMPDTKNTHGIVGEHELRTLPRHAFLLNPARGPLVQEAALLRALREGWIAGAALDTHYHYPMPADHPLWKMPNVIMTPHISGSSESPHFLARIWDIFLQNVERLRDGRPLLNELSPAQLRGE
jgi:phosphoglycerate dehydrogenase-like enzyme